MIGDVLTSSILFEALKKKFPEATLHYLVNTHTFPVVENHPHIDKFVFFTPEIESNYLRFFKFLKNINAENYDVVIDVYGKLSSKFISFRSGAPISIAYKKKNTSFIYSHNIKRSKKPKYNTSLAIENRLKLLKPLGVEFTEVVPKIYLTSEEIDTASKTLEEYKIISSKPLFMISVLGSTDQKTYPPKYMAKVLDMIIEQKPDSQLLFNYIPNQKKQAKQLFELCSKETQNRIYFDLYGKNLREFMALTSHCDALIGNEGGAVNMAKALQIPTFIIFSPHLNKENWFHGNDTTKNVAVHLSDFIKHTKEDMNEARKEATPYYKKFKPELFQDQLIQFIEKV
ncbi:glycosyltransferase family 9 protein [Jejudonia soesokkakensis]|uniref:Glycosyltransferase family 9 protein n=1 Tax=Jejudonia soesokkakensis TaxID=1323432 RepID=A0ABW2MXA6_9FLAO